MANDRLRSAIIAAGLTVQDLSQTIEVDPKTIDRWVTGARLPHAVNRQRLAVALGADEGYLWPDALSDSQIQSASMSELIAVYPSRPMIPTNEWERLLAGSRESIDILAFAGSFLHDTLPNFHEDLLARATGGVRVRLLFGDPDSVAVAVRGDEEGIGTSLADRCRLSWKYYRRLIDVPNIEGRMHRNTLYASMFRFDEDLLINHHLFGAAASHSPVHHLHRLPTGRLFSTAMASFERVWDGARRVSAEDLA